MFYLSNKCGCTDLYKFVQNEVQPHEFMRASRDEAAVKKALAAITECVKTKHPCSSFFLIPQIENKELTA